MRETLEAGGAGTADFMRRRGREILEEWERDVRSVPRARELSKPALVDHIPHLLERIAQLADHASLGQPAELPRADAEKHAATRLDEGFDLSQVIWEFSLLRKRILKAWDEDEMRPHGRGGARLLNAAIDATISASVDRYVHSRDRTLEALDRISTAALESRSLDELLRRLLAVLVETTASVDTAAILLRTDGELQLRAAVGLEEALQSGLRMRIGEGFAGGIAADRQPRLVKVASGARLVQSEMLKGVRALYGVPLTAADEVIGVAHIGSLTAFDFSDQDKRLLAAMASRASLAIQNALLTARERAGNAAARAFRAAASLDEAIPALLAELGQALGWEVGIYWQLNAAADALQVEHFWSGGATESAEFERASRQSVLHWGKGLPGRAWESHRALWVRDVRTDPDFTRQSAAAAQGLHSAIAFPVLAGGNVLGVLEFLSHGERSPAEEGVQLTTLVAGEVTEYMRRIAIQKSLQRSEAQKAAILDAARDAIVSMDAAGRIVAWNSAAERMFGYSREEAVGQELATLVIPPRLRDAHRAGLARYLGTGKGNYLNQRIEVAALRRDGSEFPTELTITEVAGESPALFTGFLRDITERKRTEAELRKSEELFRATYHQAAIGIAHVALDGRWLRLNQRYCEILGCSQEELTSMGFPDVTHPEDTAADQAELQRLAGGETDTFSREKRYIRKDGSVVWVNVTVSLVRGATGKPDYFIKIAEDISDRKQLDETRERFIGILGHDLRNPLATIALSADALLQSDDVPDHRLKTVRRIAASSRRMGLLIDEVLDFTRGRLGGGIPITPVRTNLREVCRDVLDEIESSTPGLRIELETRGDTQGEWDPQRLAQVISNLASNAVQHRTPDSTVRVSLDGTAEEVVLVVNNATECGTADPSRLFDPFRRGDLTRDTQPRQGLGLGLYITREIVLAHGGRIEATCTAADGFTVTIRLPRRA